MVILNKHCLLFFVFLALAVLATCLMCMLRPLSEIEKDAEKITGGTKNVAMEKSVGEIVRVHSI